MSTKKLTVVKTTEITISDSEGNVDQTFGAEAITAGATAAIEATAAQALTEATADDPTELKVEDVIDEASADAYILQEANATIDSALEHVDAAEMRDPELDFDMPFRKDSVGVGYGEVFSIAPSNVATETIGGDWSEDDMK